MTDIENGITLSSSKDAGKQIGSSPAILFAVFEFARMNDVDSQSHPPSKGTDRYRASADIRQEGERGEWRLSESGRERRDLVVSIAVIKSIL